MADAPGSLQDRTVIITGGASGIGLATARRLRARGARLVLAVRDLQKGSRAADELGGGTRGVGIDLADLDSVRAFAAGWDEPVEVLVNNAGIAAPTLERTREGVELQFGVNYLGAFALTALLLPHVTGRVVTLSSQAERQARLDLDDLGWERRPYRQLRAYADSKFADLVFSLELHRRLEAAGSQVRSLAAHPGFVDTGIYAGTTGPVGRAAVRVLAQDADAGALPVVLAATGDVPGGGFTGPRHLAHMRGGAELIGRSRRSADPEVARRLWTRSEELTGVSAPV